MKISDADFAALLADTGEEIAIEGSPVLAIVEKYHDDAEGRRPGVQSLRVSVTITEAEAERLDVKKDATVLVDGEAYSARVPMNDGAGLVSISLRRA